MVPTAVGQKCPSCARQNRRARGTPPTALLGRALIVTVVGGAAGAVLLRVLPVGGGIFGIFLYGLYGFAIGALAGRAARGRRHPLIGVTAAAGLVLGVAVTLVVLGINPLVPGAVALYVIGGGVAYLRGAGVW